MPEPIEACASCVREAIAKGSPVVLACDANLEGVLAATGITYLVHAREGQVRLASAIALQPQLGEAVVKLPSSTNEATVAFAQRVLTGFSAHVTGGCHKRKSNGCPTNCDNACVRRLILATASDDSSMPEVIHRYLRLGFAEGPRTKELIADPRVVAFDDLARYVLGECEHARQFVRFSHMSDGSFAASFSPKANVLPLVAPHFSARMGTERFCLVDPKHGVAAFHNPGQRACTLTLIDGALARHLAEWDDFADDERYVRAMWQRFYQGTGIPGRDKSQRGYDLRLHWMPKRLWDGLSELDPTEDSLPAAPARYVGSNHELT